MAFIVHYESQLRLGFSIAGFILFSAIGLLLPFRNSATVKSWKRKGTNIALAVSNITLIKVLGIAGLLSLSQHAAETSVGLLHYVEWSTAFELVIGLILFDCLIYWQHRLSHILPFLWRLHRVHHSDLEMDTTTAFRFHPVEIVLSYFLKLIFVYISGISIVTVILFEILLNFSALFHHGNYALPRPIDALLRWFVITPDMHRIHHSIKVKETNSNYGFFLSLWDRIFGSYCKAPEAPARTMPIGIESFRQPSQQTLLSLIIQPIKKG